MNNSKQFFPRRKTRQVKAGNLVIGGDAPISIQGMVKAKAHDPGAILDQIEHMVKEGCELVRLAIPDLKAARLIGKIRDKSPVPLCADIHFDHRLALESLEAGIDKLRLNPGNLRDEDAVREVARAALEKSVPIRVGANAGSLAPAIIKKYGGITSEGLVESALGQVKLLEKEDFHDIVISLKAFEIPLTLNAYRLLSDQVDYPFHIGITEAGPGDRGLVRSVAGIALLLGEGLGDTIRMSLTAPPEDEIRAVRLMLESMGLRPANLTLISCPTCGRCEYPVMELASRVEEKLKNIPIPLKVAVMGCPVNGPGEARYADIGIAGGAGKGIFFREGKIEKKVDIDDLLPVLLEEVEKLIEKRRNDSCE
ncbi:MAG: flavodoxin-dependent (E)-4-hydroxy-3-methylbut-2-enyl-diphosphate synthase [Candidatus Eremiobacteraeota bacterium]|nr:flavodoxin-dependent (E)-4-hydroxy-3-methylbut-2-enyl-diphosphate synthase [Candidatus Eremiobacteraeota bacterium]